MATSHPNQGMSILLFITARWLVNFRFSFVTTMSSRQRHFEAGYTYHVLNRAVQRQTLFRTEAEFDDFESILRDSYSLIPLRILTYVVMPNHWHFVVKPDTKEELSEFFHLLAGTHATQFRVKTGTRGEGHVYQDRFKSFPTESDGHLLCVCRYVERNALRANLVTRAEHWRWSGLWQRIHGTDDHLLSTWPVPRNDNWLERVNSPLTEVEVRSIQNCIRRGAPFGNSDWVRRTAKRLGLDSTLRPLGRPRLGAPSAS